MSGCSTSVDFQAPACVDPSETAARNTMERGYVEEENNQDGISSLNVEEEEDEDEDIDFNPFLRESYSSLSSEVEDLDTDVDDHGRKHCVDFGKELNGKHVLVMKDSNDVGDNELREETVMRSIASGECGINAGTIYAPISERECVSTIQSEDGLPCDREKGANSMRDVENDENLRTMVDVEVDGAISMRTRARYSLANCTLDELETFLQETDDEDDLQNVDDEEEYRKFLAAVLQGDDSHSLQGNVTVDEEDENDADFELELEEALESDHDEIEERRKTRRNRQQKSNLERSKKHLGESNRPLRPLLPFVPMGSCPDFEENQLVPTYVASNMPSANNGLINRFTPHQIGQLHCLIHEHVQLLVQVFSVSVLDPAKGDVAADVKKLLLELLKNHDQALQMGTPPYPRFCFFPPYVHPSVPDHKMLVPHVSNTNVQSVPEISSVSNGELISSNGRSNAQQEEHTMPSGTLELGSWVPYISGPVLSAIDVAPLKLVGSYIADVTSAVQAYKRCQIDIGDKTDFEKQSLFPFNQHSCSVERDGQAESYTSSQKTSSKPKRSKKTLAATMVESSKTRPVALVPKAIAKLAKRFSQFFNPALYPREPPPAPCVNRILFTDAEDGLLAMGLMEYNNNWKAIQQRFLPCKSSNQIFVRQKNRSSSNAPENPIKAVRRMKNSPLTPNEVSCIEMGMKRFKLDWTSIWRFFLPYRDPSLLPRQWRVATGTQKSYKADATKNAKRRLYDMKKKASKSASNRHSSSEKEGDSTDNAIEETNSGENGMYKDDAAYVHEAFLADWRPDSNASLSCFPHLSAQGGNQACEQRVVAGSRNFQTQLCSNAPSSSKSSDPRVFLRPYRARKSKYSQLVKLAPDLPPVNLPPSVRVIPQSAIKTSSKVSINTASGRMEENGALQVGGTTNSKIHNSLRSQLFRSDSLKDNAGDQQSKLGEFAAEEGGESDLQMHPLLFQASQDASLPYYPLNCGTSSSTFFGDKQPQLNLSLFHNPRQIRDAVNFLSKSSKPPEKHSSSSDVGFHPLLHDGTDTDFVHPAASVPSGAESRQRGSCNQNRSCFSSSKASRDRSSSSSASKVGVEFNAVDLDIHLNSISENPEAIRNSNTPIDHTGRLSSSPGPVTKIAEGANDSAADESGQKMNSADLPLVASRNKGNRKVSEDMGDVSLPEIVMEQEELSDSEEEFGEDVEFEHEEMTDSEGEDTSGSEQLLNIPDEEAQLDEMDEDIDNPQISNSPFDRGGNVCSTVYDHLHEPAVNNHSSSLAFNLNSVPPASPLLNPENTTARYEFGPFGIASRSNTTPAPAPEHLRPRKRSC